MINSLNSSANLRLIKKCPICSSDYRESMIQVLDENEYGVLTYATCGNCSANLLTKFTTLPQGVVGNAILTDLSPAEVLDFATDNDLHADEVLDIQHLLNKKELITSLKKLV